MKREGVVWWRQWDAAGNVIAELRRPAEPETPMLVATPAPAAPIAPRKRVTRGTQGELL